MCLTYHLDDTRGYLKAVLRSSLQSLLDMTITASKWGSIHLVNEQGTIYKLIPEGKHASDTIDIRFVPSIPRERPLGMAGSDVKPPLNRIPQGNELHTGADSV